MHRPIRVDLYRFRFSQDGRRKCPIRLGFPDMPWEIRAWFPALLYGMAVMARSLLLP